MGFDLRQDLGHAVDIGFAADEAGRGKGSRFRDQMFAAAEPISSLTSPTGTSNSAARLKAGAVAISSESRGSS